MKKLEIVLTCEHGGNEVPPTYAKLFEPHKELLRTHRGWDIGAADATRFLAAKLGVPCRIATTTRLLIELNRSLHHRNLFSIATKGLDKTEQKKLIEKYYASYRSELEHSISQSIERGPVFHLSIHSFTPKLENQVRNADIGFLYNPKRQLEKAIVGYWSESLKQENPSLRIRRNYPYRGISDGLTTHLRCKFSDFQYAGIELEINQVFPLGPKKTWEQVLQNIANSLQIVLHSFKLPPAT